MLLTFKPDKKRNLHVRYDWDGNITRVELQGYKRDILPLIKEDNLEELKFIIDQEILYHENHFEACRF